MVIGEKFTKTGVWEMILTRDYLKSRFLSYEKGGTLFLYSANLMDPERILMEIRMRKNLEYAFFSKDEIIRGAGTDYFPRIDVARNFESPSLDSEREFSGRSIPGGKTIFASASRRFLLTSGGQIDCHGTTQGRKK